MMEPEAQPRRRIPMWMVVTGLILLTVFIAIGAFAVWLRSDKDVKAADAAAKAAGVPATWAELGLVAAPPATMAALNRIDVLAMKLKSWQDSTPSGGAARKLECGQPLPDGLAAHHAALPAAELAELLSLLDSLGDNAPIRRIAMNAGSSMPEISSWRYICRLLGERVALASSHDLPKEAQRLVCAVRAMPGPETLITHLVRVSMAATVSHYLAYRMVDVRDIEPRLSATLLSLAAMLEEHSRQCFTGEYLNVRESLGDRGNASGLGLGREIPILQESLVRAGRGAMLRDGLAWICTLRTLGDMRSVIALAKANEAAFVKRRSRFNPGDILLSVLNPARAQIFQATAKAIMRLRLLAAELDGTLWPEDVFAAPGTLLRRGERDGVLMFGYSVGKDGVDDGGNKNKDDCFPLYGPVEAPATPVVVSPSK